ncbi:hypothetical protein [Streptomyces achromogenes]|uniref:hypothetical protein n=1 Tax=Streptomyces achromogenes TaxID=67255 RepID=UPI0033E3684A
MSSETGNHPGGSSRRWLPFGEDAVGNEVQQGNGEIDCGPRFGDGLVTCGCEPPCRLVWPVHSRRIIRSIVSAPALLGS